MTGIGDAHFPNFVIFSAVADVDACHPGLWPYKSLCSLHVVHDGSGRISLPLSFSSWYCQQALQNVWCRPAGVALTSCRVTGTLTHTPGKNLQALGGFFPRIQSN